MQKAYELGALFLQQFTLQKVLIKIYPGNFISKALECYGSPSHVEILKTPFLCYNASFFHFHLILNYFSLSTTKNCIYTFLFLTKKLFFLIF